MSAWICAGSPLTIADQFKAGLGAGVAASMVACPTELIKCRLQAQSGSAASPSVQINLFLAYLERIQRDQATIA